MKSEFSMKTFMANVNTVEHKWYVIDAKGKTLGRLASVVASRLRGKHKPDYTPHVDTGDHIILLNVDQIQVTGNKAMGKIYYHHTGYPGGIKAEPFAHLIARQPARVIEKAIKGMLPKGPLGRQMFRKLKVYVGENHPHAAQQPEQIDV